MLYVTPAGEQPLTEDQPNDPETESLRQRVECVAVDRSPVALSHRFVEVLTVDAVDIVLPS